MISYSGAYAHKKPRINRFFVRPILGSSIVLTALTSAFFSSVSSASELQDAESLSLNEAIQRTFDYHPNLQSFRYRFKAQEGRLTQAQLSQKPEVSLVVEDISGSGDYKALDSAQTTLSVSWVLEQNLIQKRTLVARRGISLIENEKAIAQLDSAAQTAHFFLKALSQQARVAIAVRAINLAETTVKVIEARVKAGKTPVAELYRSQAELAKRNLVLTDLKHEFQSSRRLLAAQWGSTEPAFVSLSGSLDSPIKARPFSDLKKQIDDNPQLSRYLSEERVNQARLKLAEEQRNPQWRFSAGVRRFERTDDFGLVAGISIPFGGNNNNQGRIAEARALISQTNSEAKAMRVQIETSLFVVYQKLLHGIHLAKMLRNSVIPKLELALKETHQSYLLGKYSYLEWLAVQNELLDAQSMLLDANLSMHQSKIELERLVGTQMTSPL